MAEFLVKASGHWMDNLTQQQIDALSLQQKEQFDARTQIGDIIVVKPNGWEWGLEERLPNFIVVKLPSISYEDSEHFMQSLYDSDTDVNKKLLKRRKYRVPPNIVAQYVALNQSVVEINVLLQQQIFVNNIIVKTQ